MTTTTAYPIQMHSMHVSSLEDEESPSGFANNSAVSPPPANDVDRLKNNESVDQNNEAVDRPLQLTRSTLGLPESTHTLLFTEPVCSPPFAFAVGIAIMSYLCLILTLENNVSDGSEGNRIDVPANVSTSVRVAQYLSILVALLMEEEIPTGLYLLRMIPKDSFQQKFPDKKYGYGKFFLSAVLRIANGYFFLINVFIVIIQATGVIEIFYDVLALQFVEQLDDIAFRLAKMDVFGKRMRLACTANCFETEFKKQTKLGSRDKRIGIFLKTVYFLNLAAFLAGLVVLSTRQASGYYQCNSITVEFGDDVWAESWVQNHSGSYEEWTLVYSYFNGVYIKDGTHAGRPIYREMRKFDSSPYEGLVVPAEIRYCEEEINAWVFTHESIQKSEYPDEAGCNWLLRSPETNEFDLSNVDGDWSIWTGVIGRTEVSIVCNECSSETDCNLNGKCVDGECECKSEAGVQYLGTHCGVKLKDSCRTIVGEGSNETYSVEYYQSHGEWGYPGTLFQEYSRPLYTYIGDDAAADEILWLLYSGSRWFGMVINLGDLNRTMEELTGGILEFHAFWNRAYSKVTQYVSDPTDGDTPVGVDFYAIGERGEQFGPFGALYPMQVHNQTGRGYFRCAGSYSPPAIHLTQVQAMVEATYGGP